jgi:hypothetical protein
MQTIRELFPAATTHRPESLPCCPNFAATDYRSVRTWVNVSECASKSNVDAAYLMSEQASRKRSFALSPSRLFGEANASHRYLCRYFFVAALFELQRKVVQKWKTKDPLFYD